MGAASSALCALLAGGGAVQAQARFDSVMRPVDSTTPAAAERDRRLDALSADRQRMGENPRAGLVPSPLRYEFDARRCRPISSRSRARRSWPGSTHGSQESRQHRGCWLPAPALSAGTARGGGDQPGWTALNDWCPPRELPGVREGDLVLLADFRAVESV